MTVTIANAISAGLFCGAPRILLVDPEAPAPEAPEALLRAGHERLQAALATWTQRGLKAVPVSELVAVCVRAVRL